MSSVQPDPQTREAPYLGENLIFLISMPRSGSTMLQRVLVGHSEIESSAEPWLMLPLVYSRRENGLTAEYGGDWARLATDEFLANYTDGPDVYDAGIRAFAKEVYGNALALTSASRFVDKTPRYTYIIKDLIRIFPEAKFIFLLRNPLSVLASIINTQLDGDLWSITEFIGELEHGPKNILEGTQIMGNRAAVVRYEDFVGKPEKHTAHLCEFLGLKYEANMVNYKDTPEAKGFMTDRIGVQQHDRPVANRAHAWEKMLTDPQQTHFAEEYLKMLEPAVVDSLGYDYGHLHTSVQQAKRSLVGFKDVFPWRVAIQQDPDMNTRDYVRALVNREGLKPDTWKGFWVGLRLYWGQISHAIGHLFGKRKD
jgi:hypothetical protein